MSELNIFEVATRGKVRFEHKGNISIEELWDLSLSDLNSIFRNLKSKVSKEGEENLFDEGKTKAEVEKSEALELQIEIVKHIAVIKKAEKDAREKEAENKALAQKILSIKSKRADTALIEASDEELDRMLEGLK